MSRLGWEPVPVEECQEAIVGAGIEEARIRRFTCRCGAPECVGEVLYAAQAGRIVVVPTVGPAGSILMFDTFGLRGLDGLLDELQLDPNHVLYQQLCREFGATLN